VSHLCHLRPLRLRTKSGSVPSLLPRVTDHWSVDRSPFQEYLRFLPRDLMTILQRKMRRRYKRNQRTSLKIWRKRRPSSPPSSLLLIRKC
jgi:hypothetical protein